MPSPRAVLADIHDHDLDPTVSYGNVSKKGRIAPPSNKVEQKNTSTSDTSHHKFEMQSEPQIEHAAQHVAHEFALSEHQATLEIVEPPAITPAEEHTKEQPAAVTQTQEEDLSKLNKKQRRKLQ
jgi:hypothetical protein